MLEFKQINAELDNWWCVKCNACLNLNKFMQNWTTDDVQKLAYTSRQLNTLPEHPLMLFNCVIICTAEQMESVAKSLQQCFNHTEFGYWHNQACSTSGKSPFWIKFCIPWLNIPSFFSSVNRSTHWVSSLSWWPSGGTLFCRWKVKTRTFQLSFIPS